MTATSLFDILSRDAKSLADGGDTLQLAALAEKMITGCLSDLGRLRGYEQDLALGAVQDPKLELELRQTIWQLYKDWAVAAGEIYHRALSLRRGGATIEGLSRLNDEIGRIEARLTLKPEQILKARQQVRDGQIVPAKELRDELNARLRG